MNILILGGAPGGNWLPLLAPIAALLLLYIAGEQLLAIVKRKLHR